MEGRHGDQRPVRPRLARGDVRPERPPRRLPGPRPRDARPARRSSSRRGKEPAPPGPRRRHGHRLRPGDQREDPRGAGQERGRRATSTSPTPTWRPIDVKNGGKYVVVADRAGRQRRPGPRGPPPHAAAGAGQRLFGFFGSKGLDHLPYRTADGQLRPRPRPRRPGRSVHPGRPRRAADPGRHDPRRADRPGRPARRSRSPCSSRPATSTSPCTPTTSTTPSAPSTAARRRSARSSTGSRAHSNWDESVLIVTSDHGHYLVVDDPKALIAPEEGRAGR